MQKSAKIKKREIKIYYKTENMFTPQLKYKFDESLNEVAYLLCFVPTFEPLWPQETVEISSEAPDEETKFDE